MNEITILVGSIKSNLQEIANHASTLGNGLLHAAPGDKADKPNPSVAYLLAMAETIQQATTELDKLAK